MTPVSAQEIETLYAERRPEGHFFDPGTKRFFRSRIGAGIAVGPWAYFVTSEKGPDEVRRWTLRLLTPDGGIDAVQGFQAFDTRDDAQRKMRRAARIHTRLFGGAV